MKNKELNIRLNNGFSVARDTILEVMSQLFKQEFSLDQSISSSGAPQTDFQNEEFPKLVARFKTGTPYSIQHIFTLPSDLALNLFAWMVETEADSEISDEHLEGLNEAINTIIGQLSTTLAQEGGALDIDDLQLSMCDTIETLEVQSLPTEGSIVNYTLTVSGNTSTVNHYLFADLESVSVDQEGDELSDEAIDKLLDQEGSDPQVDSDTGEVNVQNVEFGTFDENAGNGSNGQPRNIDMLLDVDLEVMVELGHKTMLIKEILKLGKGSVIELDKAAGEPLGMFVNGRKLAEGEVVVVDDRFGIRITQLAGTSERIKSLG